MTEPLTYRLDYRFPIAVVRFDGELTPLTTSVVRSAVRESLLEEPASVIIDLTDVTAVHDVALQVLPGAAAQASGWPGSSVLVCAPPGPVATALQRISMDSELPVYSGFPEALTAAAADPVPQRIERRLEPTVQAPRLARELVADACTEWDLPDVAIAAEILVSELVTNAVRHARTPIDIRATLREGLLRVSVRDRAGEAARLRTIAESDDHGRGLLIVDSVAAAWGNEPVADGKIVWASLRVPSKHAAIW